MLRVLFFSRKKKIKIKFKLIIMKRLSELFKNFCMGTAIAEKINGAK